MKEKYLETAKFKRATLSLEKLELPKSLSAEILTFEELPFTGKLNLHGVEKPVTGKAVLKKNGSQIEIVAKFGLKIGDFAIAVPSFAGITVAEEVNVEVQFQSRLVVH
jgi:polyisoprenoid-binding protein YceI